MSKKKFQVEEANQAKIQKHKRACCDKNLKQLGFTTQGAKMDGNK